MSVSITDAERLTYTDNFISRVENVASVLWPLFRMDPVEGLMKRYDFIGNVSGLQQANSRFTPISGVDPLHTNRWLSTAAKEQAIFVDPKDVKNAVIDPKSMYMNKLVNAFIRDREDICFSALGGAPLTGETGTGSAATLPSGSKIDSAGTYNLTLEKLQDTLFTLETRAFVHQNPGMTLYFVWTPDQKRAMLRTTEVTNSDYNVVKALVNGQIDTYMGFKFITSVQVPSTDGLAIGSSVNRLCYAFTSEALVTGEGLNKIVDVYQRKDLTKFPWQMYALHDLGALRLQDEHVVQVTVNETA